MCNVILNNELKGIELVFNSKPETNVLDAIKSNGFRWHKVKKLWYAKQSEERIQFANSLKETETNNQSIIHIEEKQAAKRTTKKEKNNVLSLWEATKWNELEISQSTKDQDCKELAKEIRSYIRKRFPYCKFSITVPYYGRIRFDITSSPFEKDSKYLAHIKEYCSNLLNAYKHTYRPSDPYSDYAGVYNFSGWAEISWEYTQTEQTEAVQKDMNDFDAQLEAFEQAEEERKRAEFQEYLKQQEENKKAYELRKQEEERQIEEINNSINVVQLDENEKYFVIGSQFAHLNKNNTLEQYQEEVNAGEFYLQNVEIAKEVHFQTEQSLKHFSNLLLTDFEWIEKTGGSRTDDTRINSMTDYNNMDAEERETVEFYSCDCIAVYYNNELQFVIDAQGFSYARYVGLCENVTIQKTSDSKQYLALEQLEGDKQQADKLEDISFQVISDNSLINTWNNENWNEYKTLMKEAFKQYDFKLSKNIIRQLSSENENLKVAMYKLLTEVDGIQEQFNNANLQQGQKVTLFYIGDMGGLITSHITIDKVENSKYAQYDNTVKITFKQPRKHGLYYKHFYSDMLVYDGWHELPTEVLHNVKKQNGFTMTSSKFLSCDKKAYDAIMDHFEEQEQKTLINTYRPTF